jgi:uridine kinase
VPDLSAAVDFILDEYPRLFKMCEKAVGQVKAGDFIFIGGLSRCGKSNFASCLKESLKAQGKTVVVLSLDRWLRNSDDRMPGVSGRYEVNEISSLLSELVIRSKTVELKLPVYDKINQQQISDAEKISIEKDDVVIVEGTIALTLLNLIQKDVSHPWFVEIDEKLRHQRVLTEYRLRGMSIEEAERIYQARQYDESSFILSSSKFATQRFELNIGGTCFKEQNKISSEQQV